MELDRHVRAHLVPVQALGDVEQVRAVRPRPVRAARPVPAVPRLGPVHALPPPLDLLATTLLLTPRRGPLLTLPCPLGGLRGVRGALALPGRGLVRARGLLEPPLAPERALLARGDVVEGEEVPDVLEDEDERKGGYEDV